MLMRGDRMSQLLIIELCGCQLSYVAMQDRFVDDFYFLPGVKKYLDLSRTISGTQISFLRLDCEQ